MAIIDSNMVAANFHLVKQEQTAEVNVLQVQSACASACVRYPSGICWKCSQCNPTISPGEFIIQNGQSMSYIIRNGLGDQETFIL